MVRGGSARARGRPTTSWFRAPSPRRPAAPGRHRGSSTLLPPRAHPERGGRYPGTVCDRKPASVRNRVGGASAPGVPHARGGREPRSRPRAMNIRSRC